MTINTPENILSLNGARLLVTTLLTIIWCTFSSYFFIIGGFGFNFSDQTTLLNGPRGLAGHRRELSRNLVSLWSALNVHWKGPFITGLLSRGGWRNMWLWRLTKFIKQIYKIGNSDVLPTIQMRWKLRLAVTPLLAIRSQQIFVHATPAQLSCHVQKFVAITVLQSWWEWN